MIRHFILCLLFLSFVHSNGQNVVNGKVFDIDTKEPLAFANIIFNDNPLSICNGQTITLETIPMRGVVFNWSKGTNTGATSDIVYADANPGTVIVTLTATGDGGACVTNTSITVNQSTGSAPLPPTITSLLSPPVVIALLPI